MIFRKGLSGGSSLLTVNKCGESDLSGITPRCLHAINQGMRRENIQNFIKINFFGILEVELSTEYTFAYKLKIQRKNKKRFKEQLISMQKKLD